jgi:hypothetical protein
MSDEVSAALGGAGVHDELAGDVVERADHRHFLGLSGGGHPQVRAALGPSPRQIRMGEGLALVAVEQNDIAGLGLGLAQLEAQPHALDLVGVLAAFQRVPGPPPAEVFFRSALDMVERLTLTRSCRFTSSMRRGIVQFGRSATGASRSGVTTRSAASAFSAGSPGATLALNASTPPPEVPSLEAHGILANAEHLGDAHTRPSVQCQQDGAGPIRLARSRDWASSSSCARCSSLARNMDGQWAGHPDHVSEVNWIATLRGRAGVLVTPKLLLFATAGAAWLNQTFTHVGHHE